MARNTLRDCFEPALERLDLLLHREILRLRARYQLALDEFRGLYISDQQVDHLVADWAAARGDDGESETLSSRAANLEKSAERRLRDAPTWRHLTREFCLDRVERDLVLLAFAPELNVKYETLYAYLNNDVTRKYPTVDLAMRLFTGEPGNRIRASLSPVGRLFAGQLLEIVGERRDRHSLSTGFLLSPAVVGHLLDLDPADPNLHYPIEYMPPVKSDWSRCAMDDDLKRKLQTLTGQWSGAADAPWIVLQGESGSGRLEATRLTLGSAGRGVVVASLTGLTHDRPQFLEQIKRLQLQARLRGAGLFLHGLDQVMTGEVQERRLMSAVLDCLKTTAAPLFFAIAPDLPWRAWLSAKDALGFLVRQPEAPEREFLWGRALADCGLQSGPDDCAQVADRFVLNQGQIATAVSAIRHQRPLERSDNESVTRDGLFAAAQEQSVTEIGRLAQKLRTVHSWQDLVLSAKTLQRIRDIVLAVQNRGVVYREWGMQSRVGGASGLMVLFSGTSGTGKTMTAGIIAREIGLDLYRIDLSAIVSKYIGETEKNLDRIFRAARRANCVLFFDEADALFGKRSEVKDAHDRYANIEIAYLLQKMEEHDGVVILATNIAKNLDSAFSRRLHYIIEFARPNAEQRERLWRGMFSARTPLADDVDFAFLARQFEITGGDIKTIALDAAMLAAGNGQVVTMTCLVQAMARQLIKQGQVPSPTDFKQHFGRLHVNPAL